MTLDELIAALQRIRDEGGEEAGKMPVVMSDRQWSPLFAVGYYKQDEMISVKQIEGIIMNGRGAEGNYDAKTPALLLR